jgi:hypothetical protein
MWQKGWAWQITVAVVLGVAGLGVPPTRGLAASLKFSESWKQKVVCAGTDCALTDAGKASAKVVVDVAGVDVTAFDSNTPVFIALGEAVLIDGVLGDAPDFVSGGTKATLPVVAGGTTVGSVKLGFKPTQVSATLKLATRTGEATPGQPILASQFDDQNQSALVTNLCARMLVGGVIGDFRVDLTGKASTKDQTKGTETFPVTTVSLKGNGVTADCFAVLTALAGQDQPVVLGETVVLNAGAQNARGTVAFLWQLLDKPAGSAVTVTNPAAVAQAFAPDVVGDYVFQLVATDDTQTSEPDRVTLTAGDQPRVTPVEIAVANVGFTAAVGDLVDPSSALLVDFSGPVAGASLTVTNVTLTQGTNAVAVGLAFDAAQNRLTVTPAALAFGKTYRLEIRDVAATVLPFHSQPFGATFFTTAQPFARVTGVVLSPQREPLPLVTVRLGPVETVTDENGEFLLEGVPTGAQVLDIDPSTIEDDAVVYTPMHFSMDIQTGVKPNRMPGAILLTRIDTASQINFPGKRVLTNPQLPGWKIDFTGCTLTDPVTSQPYVGPVTLSEVVPSDVPMPFPGASLQFTTIQPGGLVVNPPAQVTMPLPIPLMPGQQVQLWAFNHSSLQWENYGPGQVNDDGVTATSLPGQGLPFTGWHAVVTLTEVTRDIGVAAPAPALAGAGPAVLAAPGLAGTVVDAHTNALHGVEVRGTGGDVAVTDYDSVLEGLSTGQTDGTIDGDFLLKRVVVGFNQSNVVTETFLGFVPTNVVVRVLARSLTGQTFAKDVPIDVTAQPGYNPAVPDGNLPATLTTPGNAPIMLDDYKVVDDRRRIQLHRDVLVDDHSHVIRPRPATDLIAATPRYKQELQAVSRKLASLGFREDNAGAFLMEVDTYRNASDPVGQAARLFNFLAFEGGIGTLANFNAASAQINTNALQQLNATNGVMWVSLADVETETGFDYVGVACNAFGHAGLIDKLAAITNQSELTTVSRARGGQRLMGCTGMAYGQTHLAGGQMDMRALGPTGATFAGYFYRPLSSGGMTTTVTILANDTPAPNEEFTAAMQAAGITEAQAIASNKTWRTIPAYSRTVTQQLINELNDLTPTQTIYNDPALTGVIHTEPHRDHIHVSYRYDVADIEDEGTGGAPMFMATAAPGPVLAGTGFQLADVEPPEGTEWADPAQPLVLHFTAAVDPATLSSGAIELVNHDTGAAMPVTLILSTGGTELLLVPAQELPANAAWALQIGPGLFSEVGDPLELPAGVVTTFRTGLSSRFTRAELSPATFTFSRSNLAGAPVAVNGLTENGQTQDVTRAIVDITHRSEGGLSFDQDGSRDRLTTVWNGRSQVSVVLNSGVIAGGIVDAPLLTAPALLTPFVPAGEPVQAQFFESLAVNAAQLAEVRLRDALGFEYDASVTLTNNGMVVVVQPLESLPVFEPLTLLVTVRLRDGGNRELEVVVPVGFTFVGGDVMLLDTDNDGIPDVIEAMFPGCLDPLDADTDNDGLPDGGEDCDGDSLTNLMEVDLGTSVGLADTDGDSRPDGLEINVGCNPLVAELGALTGRVVDEQTNALAGATVQVLGRIAITDAQGGFLVTNVPACPPPLVRVLAATADDRLGYSGFITPPAGGVFGVGDIIVQPIFPARYPNPLLTVSNSASRVMLADINADGWPDVLGAKPSSGLFGVQLGNGDRTFQPFINVNLGVINPSLVELADLNADNNLDLVVASGFNLDQLSILLGTGTGTFSPPSLSSLSNVFRAAAFGDVNGDGKLDMVATGVGKIPANLFTELGNGAGGLTNAHFVYAPDTISDLALADLDADGQLDVVVSGSQFFEGHVRVLKGNGDGSFAVVEQFGGTTTSSDAVALADLNQDSLLDAVTANAIGTVSVLLGNSNTIFGAESVLAMAPVAGSAAGLAVGDLNDDGAADLVASQLGGSVDSPGVIAVRLGNGDGSFQAAAVHQPGFVTGPPLLSDLESDGVPELLVSTSSGLVALLQNGEGLFESATPFGPSFGDRPQAAAVGDLNGDTHLDVVTANRGTRTVSILLGRGDGTFEPETRLNLPGSLQAVDVLLLPLDDNATLDIVVAMGDTFTFDTPGALAVFLGNGDGTVQTQALVNLSFQPVRIAAGDMDGDGRTDIVSSALSSTVVLAVLRSTGTGDFATPQLLTTNALAASSFVLGDVDADGNLDAVIEAGNHRVCFGNGDGTFQIGPPLAGGAGAVQALADLNLDGTLDLLGRRSSQDGGFLRLGNGDGTFQAQQFFASGTGVLLQVPAFSGIQVADLDADGVPDLVVGAGQVNSNRGAVVVLRSRGNGTFDPPEIFNPVFSPTQVLVGDFNEDGLADVITAGSRLVLLLHQ